ncbi:hypothetical protein ABTW24_03680 [Sphingobacterium thalpophilum]|uniref:DUF4397 domain-containing protein n=1 Tax=Sphingobacterium thalpophilum TaxID=259 RepID=A0ABV4H868_9SPHI|nr:hypothetical protein [Sphingobacterium thalpophilum]
MKIIYCYINICLLMLLTGCSKEEAREGGASLTMVHAVAGLGMLKTNFKGTDPIGYENATVLRYGAYTPTDNQFGLSAGQHRIGMFEMPDTLNSSQPRFLVDLHLEMGSINTLYFIGTKESAEYVLRREEIPYYAATDSVMGLRFANLSPSKIPVQVRIRQQGSSEWFQQGKILAYKDITSFQQYAVSSQASPIYTIEFRNVETDELLADFTIEHGMGTGTSSEPNRWIYRNFTVALIGGEVNGLLPSPYQVMVIRY